MNAVTFAPILKTPKIICGQSDAKVTHQPGEQVEVAKPVQAASIFTLAAAK